ncbi:MAG: [FeFe] hydrogenase H-cluster radical SAM maturase HydE [Firmicutes bacterium]|nr:[FeFe] hydrogenase H-cluster radical SAM maturase HydE [Bacillota bacterium]
MLKNMIDKIERERDITFEELKILLTTEDKKSLIYLAERGAKTAEEIYGRKVFIRGLIEFTNYCRNDCYYCGIRRSNNRVQRYRLTKEQILSCCAEGYRLGFYTFVLQGGEDPYFNDNRLCDIIAAIKTKYPDCAVTLSFGERSKESYQAYFDAGADRYLLRHETADKEHYGKLHPAEMSFENRRRCLMDLKDIGFQTGCGFMVGSPYQSVETIYKDLQFIREIQPEMVGIGPFIPQKDTPFCNERAGAMDMTVRLLSIIRLIHPPVLLPATTALGTIDSYGRERGILAGANVIMPNLSPLDTRDKYSLYDNKAFSGYEAAECLEQIQERIRKIGYEIVKERGDFRGL